MRLFDPFFEWCGSCGRPGVWLCLECYKKTDLYSPQRCLYCHKPSLYGLTHTGCFTRGYVDGAISTYFYRGTYLRVLKRAKFQGLKHLITKLFFSILPQNLFPLWDIRRFFSPHHVVYIPMTKTDENTRGYNQSQELAKYISDLLNIPLRRVLIKQKKIRHQSTTKLGERSKNIKGVFSLFKKTLPTETRVLLVDDVVTTGSTVNEAARVLKENGCGKVFVWSLFRAH